MAEQETVGFSLLYLALSFVLLWLGHGRNVGVNGRVMVKAADGEGLLQPPEFKGHSVCAQEPQRTPVLPAPGCHAEMQVGGVYSSHRLPHALPSLL